MEIDFYVGPDGSTYSDRPWKKLGWKPPWRRHDVQDKPSGRSNYMDADSFARAIAESKIEPGSPVTARVTFEDVARGLVVKAIARGTKGVVKAVGKTTQTVLVEFVGDPVPRAVRIENLVETYIKPAEPIESVNMPQVAGSMRMNKKQKQVIGIVSFVMLMLLLNPPFKELRGRFDGPDIGPSCIFSPPQGRGGGSRINVLFFFCEYLVVGSIGAMACLCFKDKA